MDLLAINNLPTLSVASIGDAVYTLYVRQRLLTTNSTKASTLHTKASFIVNAISQSVVAEKVLPLLTTAESDYFRRCQNAKINTKPKNCTHKQYALATALEGLIGYLHLSKQEERLEQILYYSFDIIKE